MGRYDAAPAANGGRIGDPRRPILSRPSPVSQRPVMRLSPRRRRNYEALAEYLAWRGGRVVLDGHAYADMRRHWATADLRRHEIDAAADDLWAAGAVVLRPAGAAWSIRLREGLA